jgi:hypothetical protein
MTIKALSAIAIVAAAFSTAAFAQDQSPVTHKPVHARHFHSAYNHAPGYFAAPRTGDDWLTENYGFDRSRVGGQDPDLNPAP